MSRSRASRREATVELTPLIDVVFLLLIFFMVSTSFVQNQALQVDLPQANGSNQPSEDLVIDVLVKQNGQYEIDGLVLNDGSLDGLMKSLQTILKNTVRQSSKLSVVINADANATHQSVVRVMDACAQVGLSRISLATQPIIESLKE